MINDRRDFKSRRNRVWRDGGLVYKQILPLPEDKNTDGGPCRRAGFEVAMLNRLYCGGVFVPKLIAYKNDLLTMEYIESVTLTDFIEAQETETALLSANIIAGRLTDWFEAFYSAAPKGNIRGDVNCRNFLVTNENFIAGIDFEKSHTGSRETDLGKLLAFILTYRPEYTVYKKVLTNLIYKKFIVRFDLDPALVSFAMDCELNDIFVRRLS